MSIAFYVHHCPYCRHKSEYGVAVCEKCEPPAKDTMEERAPLPEELLFLWDEPNQGIQVQEVREWIYLRSHRGVHSLSGDRWKSCEFGSIDKCTECVQGTYLSLGGKCTL